MQQQHDLLLKGLHNYFATEALPGVLINGRNSPQKVPYGLYAEQLSGTAFTMPRCKNLSSWLYRIRPSVLQHEFSVLSHPTFLSAPFTAEYTPPNPFRWDPMPVPAQASDFIDSLFTMMGHGSLEMNQGAAIHLYCATKSMHDRYFYNSDGDFLIVPQEGRLSLRSEFGTLDIGPGEIAVIPRGVKYQVMLLDAHAKGYVCENYGSAFRLPELGVIGANGLAHPTDFIAPSAAYEDKEGHFQLITKFQGQLWQSVITHSPLDVVAWRGNLAPYKYDLHLFNTINTVSFDHPDPSIFTVLTSPTTEIGTANVDFVIFPARWMVATDTFRPPYYHRNIMSEFMGLIYGQYDAKETGFLPGGCSLHNRMVPHGPDADSYHKGVESSLMPDYYTETLAFMFESYHSWQLTAIAYHAAFRQQDYAQCWQGLRKEFIPLTKGVTTNV